MQTLIDIIAASFLAGMILLTVIRMNGTVTETTFQTTLAKITQENSTTIADMINHDFYKIGYHDTLDPVNPVIQYADSEHIAFRSDIDNDGVVDTISYYTSDIVDSMDGSAVVFKKLYRTKNSDSPGDGARLGLTSFKLSYFDGDGSLITLSSPTSDTIGLSNIKSIRVEMFVKNPIAFDTTGQAFSDTAFGAVYWEKFISPKNLRNLK